METYVTSLADVGRNVKRFMKLFVDTGANKTLVGEEDADTLHDQTPSDITITGTADADWQGLPSRVLGRTDRGSEFFGYDSTYLQKDKPKILVEFEKVAAEEGVQKVEASPRDGNKGNGICERHHRTIFDIASGFLRQSHVSPLFWVEAYRYATLLYNPMTTSHTGQQSA